ncbi:hypothetical protein BJ912DRAFT_1074363 [Pholiota molesta]|nr:hypothetical protein BJ912DRAFT_1074363 [Pholiota molesta]
MAKKSKTPKQPGFTVDSTQHCDVCSRDVHIGLGGEKNWEVHVASISHQKAVLAKAALPKKNLLSFFMKTSASIPAASANSSTAVNVAPAPLGAPSTTPLTAQSSSPSTIPKAPSESISHTIPHVSSSQNPPSITTNESDGPLLRELHRAIVSLPSTIPLATSSGALAGFAYNPTAFLEDGQDAWEEVVNPALDRVLGFGADAASIRALVYRGDYGMDGLYRYLQACVSDLKIDAGLFEGKIRRLIEAMNQLTPSQAHEQVRRPDQPQEPIIIPSRTPSPACPQPPATSTSTPDRGNCPGYRLELPEDVSPFSSYPFLLHTKRDLPWSVVVDRDNLILRSTRCTHLALSSHKGKETKPLPCHYCSRLHDNDVVMGIRHRILDGTHENTPWVYLTPAEMYASLQRKTKVINNLKLRALNNAVSIGIRNRKLKTWKRLVMAIGKSDIARLRSLIAAQVRAGASVYSILEKVDKAALRQFSPKGYERADYEREFLILKMGGTSAANVAHRSLGLPSIDATKRHVVTVPLQASAKFPTHQELSSNLQQCYPREGISPDQPKYGMSIQYDELKVQERLRWDPRTNNILGLCREHSKSYALEFRSIEQANTIAEALRKKDIHLATEVTVIGSSILCEEPRKYVTKPFGMSGSCKQETVHDQEKLIRSSVKAIKEEASQLNSSLYCLCTDGDARRRQALINICMKHDLDSQDPIFSSLSQLPLFNLKCGDDGVTADFDWKHVLKRFRNTAIRQKGFKLNGRTFSTPILRKHLKSLGMSNVTIDSLLSPNDKQDVTLMTKLLHAVSQLASTPDTADPLSRTTREMLRLLGRLYGHLLNAYLDISLSLHQQLSELSAAAHLVLALYHLDKGDFVPVQTYFDVMSMIKNVYFCVAKAQRDNPTGRFFIILLGTDGLEKIFGKVRTMVGNDTNADVFQLANRIDGAVKCVNILEVHPEWGGDARRLNVKPLKDKDVEITSAYDHLNPSAFTGDLRVSSVVLLGSWTEGRRVAEQELRHAGIDPPFAMMEEDGGYDILCPLGENKIVLVGGLETGERHETEEECEGPMDAAVNVPTPLNDLLIDPQPDMDDLTSAADIIDSGSTNVPQAYVPIDFANPSSKPVHKSSILRIFSDPLTINESRDRLKRVRGYSRYNEAKNKVIASASASTPEDTLDVQDPAFTLVHCDHNIFLAAFQVLSIRHDGQDLPSIPSRLLHEPNVRIHGQIMKLSPIHVFDTSHQPEGADWEWNGNFESQGVLRELNGRFVEQIDPQLQPASRGRNVGEETYVFKTSELRAIAALMYEKLEKESLPKVPVTDSFPYRTGNGDACFVCEKDTVDGQLDRVEGVQTCPLCPNVKTGALGAQDLLRHMGTHILNDPRLLDADGPCGLCLNTGSLCEIFLFRRGEAVSIDLAKSQCPNLRPFHIKKAEEFTIRQPFWKYNLERHIVTRHPLDDIALYSPFFNITEDERKLMKLEWDKLKRFRARPTKESRTRGIKISDSHSSRLALRNLANEGYDAADDVVPHEFSGLPAESDDIEAELQSSCRDPEAGLTGEDHDDWDAPLYIASSSPGQDVQSEGENVPHDIDAEERERVLDHEPPPVQVEVPTANDHIDVDVSCTSEVEATSGSRRRQKRRNMSGEVLTSEEMCQDDGCGRLVTANELLVCKGPLCGGIYHLTCRGLVKMPVKDWYCDDDCKMNATGSGTRKRRRKKI